MTTEWSLDLGVPEHIWILVSVWPSGRKYKDTYFPLKDGSMPKKLRKSLARLEARHKERYEAESKSPFFHKDWCKPNWELHTVYPAKHPNRPTLFEE